jgi:hypothetical protein
MGSIREVFGYSEVGPQMKPKRRIWMSDARLWPRVSRLLVAVVLAGSLMCAHLETQHSGASFERWVKAHAIQLQTTASLEPGGLDAALSRVGPPLFLLDLRAARSDRAVAAWLAERRQLRTNFTTSLTVSPSVAFDALLFVNTLTPARATTR